MMPWTDGATPVVREVRAVAVVVGHTEVMGPPVADARVGADRAKAWSCSHPSPSRTRRTIWRAPCNGVGTHVDALPSCAKAENRAGMTALRLPPS